MLACVRQLRAPNTFRPQDPVICGLPVTGGGTATRMSGLEDIGNANIPDSASSKPAGGKNTQSGKQEGLSNTDTKHSTDITNDSSKSKKGEGSPETAKSKGTVDPQRKQV